jgi:hypothetical protein
MKSSFRTNMTTVLIAAPLAAWLQVCQAQQSPQRTFASAEDASQALFIAAEADETGAVAQILGQEGELIGSSDADQDKLDRAQFVRKYREMHRLARDRNAEVVLYIGAENWPFPIPLVAHDGVWHYDADAGKREVLYRRIGENEVAAIETCRTLSTSLKKPQAPEQVTAATPGYSYRMLSNSILAYPTVYGSSGVMTFIVSDTGVVYQKDLGASTGKAATRIARYHTDSTWTPAKTGLENPD